MIWRFLDPKGERAKYIVETKKNDPHGERAKKVVEMKKKYNGTSSILSVQIAENDLKEVITAFINDYIRIEKNETSISYQQKQNFKRGQIDVVTSLMGEKWDFHETGQTYHEFLKYLVEKYELNGVWRIDDL